VKLWYDPIARVHAAATNCHWPPPFWSHCAPPRCSAVSNADGARSFINGLADPGESVVVQVGQAVFPATADSAGAWQVEVNHGAGDVTVTTSSGEVAKAANAAGGDVFFCSGQSNMVFPMDLTFNATEEMATLKDFPHFSFFMTALDYADTPQFDLKPDPSECVAANASLCARSCAAPGMCNRWVTAAEAAANNNSYLSQFSAVCFMAARDIAKMHTGTRPVGLVFSAWGGTRVEAWMSTDAIAAASKAVVPGKVITPPDHGGQNNVSALCVTSRP
jgi:sialate O-acetylesterase